MTIETFNYTGRLQIFTAPASVTSITITAIGARGGISSESGGYGASITGTFSVTPGEQLAVLVGQGGGFGPAYPIVVAGGGGGGSFVWRGTDFANLSKDTLLAAAGGGGGIGWSEVLNASTDGSGVSGNESGGEGGSNGSGGGGGYAGGGSGITGNGENGGISIWGGGTGGSGFKNGVPGPDGGGSGGFGGGGGGNVYTDQIDTRLKSSGGGGGGYSGGGGGGRVNSGGSGGGGGSYNADPNGTNIISDRAGNGIVTISYEADPPTPSLTRGILFF